jgi:branched-chain amino acid transport system permease protein
MDYLVSLAVFGGIWVVLALSLNILMGYAGQVSLGQAAFFGIGAYTSALCALRFDLPFVVGFLAAIVVTGIVGAFLGLPSLRVRHDFLVLATMGVNFVVVALFKYMDFFGGALGLIDIPTPRFFGINSEIPYLILVWLYVGVAMLVSWYIAKTWTGLALNAVRINEDAAAAVGISVPRFKIYAFIISAALAGGAGSLYAHYLKSLFPDNFNFIESIVILSMVVVGGVGTLRGPIIGAIVLRALPEMLRDLHDYRFTMYGGLIVLMMLFQPMGLLGDESTLMRWLRRAFTRKAKVGYERVA